MSPKKTKIHLFFIPSAASRKPRASLRAVGSEPEAVRGEEAAPRRSRSKQSLSLWQSTATGEETPSIRAGGGFIPLIILLTIAISTFLLLIWNLNRPSLIKKDVKIAFNSPTNTPLSFEVKNHDLSLSAIFEERPDWLEDLPESKTSTLIATGDVMLGRSVNYSSAKAQNFNWPFIYVADLLRDADITLINFEGTLLRKCPLTNEGLKFCGDARHKIGLINSGIDVASLANNHSADYGQAGIEETQLALAGSGISTVGLGGPIFSRVKDHNFAFLSYNSVFPKTSEIAWANEHEIKSDIGNAKIKADIVVVSFHWGNEYTLHPTSDQINLAHSAIDAGADVVLGHHPHWIQPVEIYKGKPIFYSLGNFVFDQMWSQKTREGIIGRLTFYEDKLVNIEVIPILIENYGQPRILTGSSAKSLMKEIVTISLQHQSLQP